VDEVSDADAESSDLVCVVKSSAGDGRAADEDRIEFGDGGEFAGAAYLEGDSLELGDTARAANL